MKCENVNLKTYIFEVAPFLLAQYLFNQLNFFSGKIHLFDEAFFLFPTVAIKTGKVFHGNQCQGNKLFHHKYAAYHATICLKTENDYPKKNCHKSISSTLQLRTQTLTLTEASKCSKKYFVLFLLPFAIYLRSCLIYLSFLKSP